jgi:hypothetical protein
MLSIEDLTDDELTKVKATFASLATPAERAIGAVREAQKELDETEEALEQVTDRLSDAAKDRQPLAVRHRQE